MGSRRGFFRAPRSPRPGRKFYCLDMFPYPSADGLHVGHPEGYTATDILPTTAMKGFDVLHPMGWDAFGLPAENFAIQTGTHPAHVTRATSNIPPPDQVPWASATTGAARSTPRTRTYYRWTQWIFLQLFKKGLAYESTAPINWCPSLQDRPRERRGFRRCLRTVRHQGQRKKCPAMGAQDHGLRRPAAGLTSKARLAGA